MKTSPNPAPSGQGLDPIASLLQLATNDIATSGMSFPLSVIAASLPKDYAVEPIGIEPTTSRVRLLRCFNGEKEILTPIVLLGENSAVVLVASVQNDWPARG